MFCPRFLFFSSVIATAIATGTTRPVTCRGESQCIAALNAAPSLEAKRSAGETVLDRPAGRRVLLVLAQADEAKPQQPENKSAEQSLLESITEGITGNEEKKAEADQKIESAIKGMLNAGEKLDDKNTASETQTIQKQVIKDLDDIINQLENPPPNQGGGGGGGGGGSGGGGGGSQGGGGGGGGRGGSSARSGRRGNSPMRMRPQSGSSSRGQAQNQSKKQNATDSQKSENSGDSSKNDQTEQEKKAREEAARRRKLEMDVWGHLPQHVREELLSTYGDRMLPKYEQMVRQFYEALSNQGDGKKP